MCRRAPWAQTLPRTMEDAAQDQKCLRDNGPTTRTRWCSSAAAPTENHSQAQQGSQESPGKYGRGHHPRWKPTEASAGVNTAGASTMRPAQQQKAEIIPDGPAYSRAQVIVAVNYPRKRLGRKRRTAKAASKNMPDRAPERGVSQATGPPLGLSIARSLLKAIMVLH